MSIDQPPPSSPQPVASPPESQKPKRSGGASVGALIGIGIGVVLLSFVASFLGASLARSNAEPAPTPSETKLTSAEYAAAIQEILPAGSAVRAGTGVPEAGKGYEGDVYIDVSTSDVYVFRDGNWVLAGNIRQNAAENLTGETGPAGETGASGAPGVPGTQVALGEGAPDDATCTADGDLYIDTAAWQFYQCGAGAWTQFGPPAADGEQTPSPSPSAED